ncbi:MAG: bifunctional phosphopantothenoylcysteine decarboxylase/phosphopantothenate--cysteine ligase CoaBC [Corynebacterium sp.]|nr:bifunctional phosphopantothenoylcysteine decarboxylase/phosphopantothenate--cysteine ligase CoaBC [Corynebacterium sp.]
MNATSVPPTGSYHTPLRIVVGISGGIAAYKACELIRRFREDGHTVRAVPTANALEFIGAATLEALSSQPVDTSVFSKVDEVQHVHVGQQADLLVIAPATADVIARLVAGRADDLLSATALMATCPVLLAPAMHTEMWRHPATRENVATLRRRGIIVMEPAHGRLTGADSGPGRLPDPVQIQEFAYGLAAGGSFDYDLVGKRVVISAGGTRERIDPVRFIGNDSSGRQGFALAQVAAQRGAHVELIAAHTAELPVPNGVELIRVSSARELATAMSQHAPDADVVIMSAAVADFRPKAAADVKLKKESAQSHDALSQLALVENPDILASLAGKAKLVVGFAAETGDSQGTAVDYARKKLKRKGCDVLICNDVSAGKVFGREINAATVLFASGEEVPIATASKFSVAAKIWEALTPLIQVEEEYADEATVPSDDGSNAIGNGGAKAGAEAAKSANPNRIPEDVYLW